LQIWQFLIFKKKIVVQINKIGQQF